MPKKQEKHAPRRQAVLLFLCPVCGNPASNVPIEEFDKVDELSVEFGDSDQQLAAYYFECEHQWHNWSAPCSTGRNHDGCDSPLVGRAGTACHCPCHKTP